MDNYKPKDVFLACVSVVAAVWLVFFVVMIGAVISSNEQYLECKNKGGEWLKITGEMKCVKLEVLK